MSTRETSIDVDGPAFLALIEALAEKCVKAYLAEHSLRSNANLCLSRDEIAEFTRARTKGRQLQFLIRNGIRHYVDASGWPVVTRAAVQGERDASPPAQAWESNKVKPMRTAGRLR